ncbi:hypothetical protein vseg_015363 [Gypsophila vaccaria]
MRMRLEKWLIVLVSIIIIGIITTSNGANNVSYDNRALVIDGQRRVLVSGSIHYPRSTPEMWADLIQKSKDGGLDIIETYVFWDLHEPVQGQYDFTGRKDLVKFVKLVGEAGLYLHLRIGPYACAEWNYGGFPLWLHFIPGIKFRTDNEPFKEEMQRFTTYIVDLMKKNNLYASQGGPIILSQINTCNGFYCDQFTPNSNQKPKLWTENWSGWFTSFGNPIPYRPVEDLAFSVARFYQRGGTMQNYYMYHGGTNFGHSSGGPFITTTYDYDAPIDEYGIIRQPKWGHLRDVHKAIKLCEAAMVATDPAYTSLGSNLEAAVYKTESGLCSAFLANIGTQSDATVNFNGNSYTLPAWSVSILPDCKNVVLNTAMINSMAVLPKFIPQSLKYNLESSGVLQSNWSWYAEPVGISKKSAFVKPGLLEQINTTSDQSDYLWYSSSIVIKGDEPFLQNGSQAVLHVESLGHGLHAFVNGKLAATRYSPNGDHHISVDIPATLNTGSNTIDFLSLTVGLQNYGAFFDLTGAGVTGPVSLRSSSGGLTVDLSAQPWTYQIGLKGEDLDLSTGSSSDWDSSAFPKNRPLTWYKASFDAPDGTDPVALDFTGMGKGEAWVNEQSIGRYWPALNSPNNAAGCTDYCDYRGSYSSSKCLKNCGKPPQQLYHVPRSWMKETGNVLVVFEEIGGDPTQISFATEQMGSMCALVSELHPPPVDKWGSPKVGPVLSLECPSPNQVISSIKFASFGTPQGTCGSYAHGRCESDKTLPIVQKACVGSRSCSIEVSINTFGDPCTRVTKSLAVEATCA